MSTQNANYYSHSDQQALRNLPSKSYIMISYSWANKEDVNVIIEKLSPYLRIWRDINSLSGSTDLWNTIAIAVQDAEFFIPIISTEYEKSDSCTNELNFALNNKQIVVPIFLNPDFRPTGNVGLRISKLYYIAFQQVIDCPFTLIKHLNTLGANYSNIYGDKNYQIKSLKVPIQSILSPDVNNSVQTTYKKSDSQHTTNKFSGNRNSEAVSKPNNGFNIRQKTADQTQFDIYSSDKDDSFSYQCSGKFVSIADFDYISCDELNKSSQPASNDSAYSAVSQLIFENVKYFFNCFVLLNEESLLLASESGQIYHLVLNNQEQNYYTYNLYVRFNGNDLDLYRSGHKLLVDMCLDTNGDLIVLSRNKLNCDQTRTTHSYSVELFGLTNTNGIQLAYKETLFVLNSEGVAQQQHKRSYESNKIK